MSDRAFSEVETNDISIAVKHFCKDWSAHGNNLKASGEIRYNRFILLMVDETAAGASGCSIDKSVHFIQAIEKEYNVHLFNRLLVAWKTQTLVQVAPLQELQQLFDDGVIDDETLIFNNTITSKKELDEAWMIPLKESWMYSRIKSTFQNTAGK